MRVPSAALAALLACALAITGCGRDGNGSEAEEPVAEPVAEGLSPEEIQRQAEPMSPEQAEQLGIVDTTIHVEQLASPEDTALRPDTAPPPGGRRP